MADRVIFMGWNRPVIGREQQALQLFQRAMEFWGKLQAEGRIEVSSRCSFPVMGVT